MVLQNSTKNPNPEQSSNFNNGETETETETFVEDIDSNCSTPYVSAPSSPGRSGGGPISSGYFYSAPASPLHFSITASSSSYHHQTSNSSCVPLSYEFEFSARFGSTGSACSGSMSSADELFLNGQIRPMKLSSHLERPQVLAPLLDLEEEEEEEDDNDDEQRVVVRGRDLRLRNKSVRRRTRSMSPLRNNTHLEWTENEEEEEHQHQHHHENEIVEMDQNNDVSEMVKKNNKVVDEMGLERIEIITPSDSASSSTSRSSSAGRSSKRWIFLKDFLRSKSEGRSNNKFWSTISFSPIIKDKKSNSSNGNLQPQMIKEKTCNNMRNGSSSSSSSSSNGWAKKMTGKPMNGVGKRRVPASPHELHYKANRAQAEELRKKTFLPYRQGLFGCLGFSSKGYGAMNGFARALNPVSSR